MSRIWARLSGEGLVSESVSYDVDHVEHGEGEAYSVVVTLDLGGLAVEAEFDLDDAEAFLVEVRDAIVRGRRAELERATDTDPSTGVSEDES